MEKKYFTTPLYYVNDTPHIGTAYCTFIADTISRYWRGKIGKKNVYLLTGTDENSQKTVDAATKKGASIDHYLDDMSANFRSTWDSLGIHYDGFIRTSSGSHHKVVDELVRKIHDKGDIYKGIYKGLYCTGCETFLKRTELDENGYCKDHLRAPLEIEEENYFFRLSKYQDQILDLLENTDFMHPPSRKAEMISFVREGLEDISISRETAEIGIPLAIDPKHKMYVWAEAVMGYYSILQNENHPDLWSHANHIIGKDITRFHTIIWPALCMSAEIELPKHVYVHGFFTVDGTKMGKSLGNVIKPFDLSHVYGNDTLRLGLLSGFEFGSDGDFSRANFHHFYDTKLANGVGNLFNRIIILIHKFLDGQKPTSAPDPRIEEEWETFAQAIENWKIKHAIDHFFHVIHETNQILNETEVWKIAKEDLEKAKEIFALLLMKLKLITRMAEILLPEAYEKMQTMLGDEVRVGEAIILFPRIDNPSE